MPQQSRLAKTEEMAHHGEHTAPLRKPHVDLWKLNRGPKLSNAEFYKLVQNPFCTWNHLKVMYPWVLSFTLVGYTMFNAFRPKNIDVKHFENSCMSTAS